MLSLKKRKKKINERVGRSNFGFWMKLYVAADLDRLQINALTVKKKIKKRLLLIITS